MKVRIVLTLDIDPDAWANEYGVDPNQVRADVKDWLGNNLQSCHLAEDEIIREVVWR